MAILLLTGAAITAGPALDALLDRLEETSRTQPLAAHIDTLLSAAELLPDGGRRRQMIESSISLLGGVIDEDVRYFYWSASAHLLASQDAEAAEQICLQIPARSSWRWRADYRGRCWQFLAVRAEDQRAVVLRGLRSGAFQIPAALEQIALDPPEGAEILQAMITAYPARFASAEDGVLLDKAARLVAPFNLSLAQEAAQRMRRYPPAAPPEKPEIDEDIQAEAGRAEKRFAAADDLGLPPGVRSNRLLGVLEATPSMTDIARRLQIQAYLAAWFHREGASGTATKAVDLLDATLQKHCRDERSLPDIDALVDFLVENRIDPDLLRVRHASFAARLLLRELRNQVEAGRR